MTSVGQVGGCPDPTTADSPRLGLLPGAAGTIAGGRPPESTKDGATPGARPRTATRRPPPTASVVGQGPSKGAGDGLALAGRSQGTASLTAQGSSLVAAGKSSVTGTGVSYIIRGSSHMIRGELAGGIAAAPAGKGVLAASAAALAGTGAPAAA